MFDLAWSELFVVGLVAVLVLGPKELPQAMRTFAKAIRKIRSLGNEFQGHINELVRDAELEEVRKQVQKFSKTSLVDHVTHMVDPKGEIAKEVEGSLADPDAKPLPAPEPGMDGSAAPAVATPGAPDVAAAEPPAAEPTPAENKPSAST
ncbi:MAG: Sec-independent protein translocase protein TatB [Rhodospirillaceae bacterium]